MINYIEHLDYQRHLADVRRIANLNARAQAASAAIGTPVKRTIDEWSDAPEWGELRQRTQITFEYGGSGAESFVAISQSPDQTIYLGEDEMVRTIRALSAALGAIRELNDQRDSCELGECIHLEHRQRGAA